MDPVRAEMWLYTAYGQRPQDTRPQDVVIYNYISLSIRHYTTFDVMKDQPTSNYSWFNDLGIIKKGRTFMRSGKVGDWENHLTEEQVERFRNEIEAPLEDAVYHRNPLKVDA